MRKFLVHDVFVEEYHVHRLMRQFGLRREFPVPWGPWGPPNVHGYTRKGVAGTTSWIEKMAHWVEQWLHALADVHRETAPYDPGIYEYIEWSLVPYVPMAGLCRVIRCDAAIRPLPDEELGSQEGADSGDYEFARELVLRRACSGPSHGESSQVSIGASQLHGAPGASQPTQHPLGTSPLATPPQATRVSRAPRPLKPLTYSHQRL